jgi:hypothetical protein
MRKSFSNADDFMFAALAGVAITLMTLTVTIPDDPHPQASSNITEPSMVDLDVGVGAAVAGTQRDSLAMAMVHQAEELGHSASRTENRAMIRSDRTR